MFFGSPNIKKTAPQVRGQSALVLSGKESFFAVAI
jgi:hypothetical protein